MLHWELVIFNFHFPKIRKVIIFMLLGPGGHVHEPQNHLFLTSDPEVTQKYMKRHEAFFQILLLEISESHKIENVGTDGCRKLLEIG